MRDCKPEREKIREPLEAKVKKHGRRFYEGGSLRAITLLLEEGSSIQTATRAHK